MREQWIWQRDFDASNGYSTWTVEQEAYSKRLRCSCPSFVYSKGRKTCKHTDIVTASIEMRAERDRVRKEQEAAARKAEAAEAARKAAAKRIVYVVLAEKTTGFMVASGAEIIGLFSDLAAANNVAAGSVKVFKSMKLDKTYNVRVIKSEVV